MLRLRYWGKLVRMGGERLAKKIYLVSRRSHMSDGARNWSSYTHEIMTMVGLQEAWESGVVGDDWDQRVFGKVN